MVQISLKFERIFLSVFNLTPSKFNFNSKIVFFEDIFLIQVNLLVYLLVL